MVNKIDSEKQQRKELLLECFSIIDNLSDDSLEEAMKALKKIKESRNGEIVIKTNNQAILNLLHKWETEGDEQEQTETLKHLLENLP